jgi:hypothetical protein
MRIDRGWLDQRMSDAMLTAATRSLVIGVTAVPRREGSPNAPLRAHEKKVRRVLRRGAA